MIEHLTESQPDRPLDVDLCIIGSGAAGITLAQHFLGMTHRVLLLEAGGLEADAATDQLNDGDVEGIAAETLHEGRRRVFGGTTTAWAGQCIPLDDIDFERRDWVAHSGWPVAGSAIEPYYRAASDLFSVPDESHDEGLWQRWRETPPPLDKDCLLHSYTAWSPRPNLGRVYRRQFKRSENIRVMLHANVVRLRIDAAGAGGSLVARSLSDAEVRVNARAIVLCCGAIENARLLLTADRDSSERLGPGADNIGRYFQDHPNAYSGLLQSEHPERLQRAYSIFYRGRTRYLPKLKLSPVVQRREEVLNCGANLVYEFEDAGLNALRDAYRQIKRRGALPRVSAVELRQIASGLPSGATAAYRRFVMGRSSLAEPRTIRLQLHTEQAPDRESRVTLASRHDVLGSPLAHVKWGLSDLERRTLATMTSTVASEFSRLGLAETEPEHWLDKGEGENWRAHVGDSYHPIGTTRISASPSSGVVDLNCQVHEVPGLFVAGSSVFPTSGFANPTLTIAALTLRLADYLERWLADSPQA